MFRLFAHRTSLAMHFSLLAAGSAAIAQDQFKLPCAQPHFPAPATSSLTIDAQCVVQGASKEVDDNAAEADQNKAKNNFCAEADGGAVTTMDMKNLQGKVQQDPSINFGNSGGPLLSAEGAVVGVTSAIFSPSGGSVGLGFAIPAETVSAVVSELETHGRVDRGYLGISAQSVTPAVGRALGVESPRGALVTVVDPKGPSARSSS